MDKICRNSKRDILYSACDKSRRGSLFDNYDSCKMKLGVSCCDYIDRVERDLFKVPRLAYPDHDGSLPGASPENAKTRPSGHEGHKTQGYRRG